LSIYETVKKIMDEYGVPAVIWYPIMQMESGGNPDSHNTNGEDSRGLFQINLFAHPQWSHLNLFDPAINARIAAENFLLPAYKQAQAKGLSNPVDQAEYTWRYGIRPFWTTKKANAIRQAVSSFSPPVETVNDAWGDLLNTAANSGGQTPAESYWQRWLKYQKLILSGKWAEAEAYRAGWEAEGTVQTEGEISEEATENVGQGNTWINGKLKQGTLILIGLVLAISGIFVLSKEVKRIEKVIYSSKTP